MHPTTRKLLAYTLPLPLFALPYGVHRAVMTHWTSQSSYLPFLKSADKILIMPGLFCGLPTRSDWVLMLSAGFCWYLLGLGCAAVFILPREQRKLARIGTYIAFAWIAVIVGLGIMWSRADID